jgi:poly-beta-1,6-N-acetyl-D-glucosamine synthase
LVYLLTNMAFPKDRFEVIIVNDHSTDTTVEQATRSLVGIENARLLNLPEGKAGKKAALQFGITEARFEIIATTDADCTLSKNWLTCVASYFSSPETKMLIGPVRLQGSEAFFGNLQVAEFIGITGTTAAAVGLGHPIMCNGANLAFRKETFTSVGGYDDNMAVASGDDEFLMRKIVQRFPDGVRFLNYFEAVVSTGAQKDFREFIQQRIRWAGKWKHNSDAVARLVAVFILASQVSFFGLLIMNLISPGTAIALLTLKIFLEGVFVYWVGRFLDHRLHVFTFIILQIIYPVYVVFVGVYSLVAPYRWKGRNYARG